ncbi:MAG: transporter, family, oxalate/formate antiporter [Chthoniobacter sp.]|jgi:OFA family oxalate/formate antiporter-like MFS transporter|nr:transporter, family, oxalate/formate antiporter [Chthoniobacter sp.]
MSPNSPGDLTPESATPGSTAHPPVKNLGWLVTLAGMGINLALGVLYSWSVVSKKIPADWNWTEADRSMPYSVACLVFSLVMVPAGRMQDRIGPRVVATLGGILVGAGMILASLTNSPLSYIIGFGLLAGSGFACGYASTTPPAVKWFPAARTGAIAGIVVAGFGLASVYVAPLAEALINANGVPSTMFWLGIGFLVVVVGLSQLLKAPPAGYIPTGTLAAVPGAPVKKENFTPGEILATWQFYVLWFMYVCGAGAGLMIISKLAKMVDVQAGLKLGYLLVACLAVGNGAGRIIAGTVSDKIGRLLTLFICFVLQAVLVMLLSQAKTGSVLGTTPVLVVLSALIGANYGANLALFPSITKDYYGLKNFGVNYGLIFTAWGLGGFSLSLLAGKVYDATKTFTFAYYCSAGLLVAAALVTFLVKPPHHQAADEA